MLAAPKIEIQGKHYEYIVKHSVVHNNVVARTKEKEQNKIGEPVLVTKENNKFIGWGIVNPISKIRVRYSIYL